MTRAGLEGRYIAHPLRALQGLAVKSRRHSPHCRSELSRSQLANLPNARILDADRESACSHIAESSGLQGLHAGGGTRTPDTRIMIRSLDLRESAAVRRSRLQTGFSPSHARRPFRLFLALVLPRSCPLSLDGGGVMERCCFSSKAAASRLGNQSPGSTGCESSTRLPSGSRT